MEYNEKLEKAKKNLEGLKSKPNNSAQVFANSDMESLYHKFNDMQDVISRVLDTTNKQANIISKSTTNKLVDMNNSLVTLSEALLQKGMHINNLKDIEKIKSVSVDNLADIKIPKTVNVDKMPDWIASNDSIKEVNKNLGLIANQLNDLDVNLKPGQTPGDFMPIRRVVSDGKTLRFDDSSWTGARGGGGSGSALPTGASTSANQDTQITAEQAIQTSVELIDDAIKVDDAAFTPGTSSVNMSGFQADEASTDSVDEGDAGAARMTLDRKVITTPQPHTTGGLTIFRSLDLDESEEEVKASAGQVYSLWFTNTATSTRWLKFYNATAANVTVGTTTPVMTLGLPGNTSDDISGVFGGAFGFLFDTAITVAATTGVADNDTGAPSANDVIVNIGYK